MTLKFAAAALLLLACGQALAAAPPRAAGEAASASEPSWIATLADEELVAVDESQVTVSPMEGGFVVEFVRNGDTQKTTFSRVGDKMGTISDDDAPAKPTGFFRLTDVGVEIQYEDGRAASLFANVDNGLTMTRRGEGGQTVCVSWYPKDHVFSAAERRAAVAAYAHSLGLNDAPPPVPAAAKKKKPAAHAAAAAPAANICSAPMQPARTIAANPVHAIDPAPAASAPAPVETQAAVKTASAAPAPETVATGMGATQCLSVEVQGAYIGFRNRCANDVQVAYCLQKASDATLACGTGTRLGSVTATGFSGVFADQAAAEHDVRWVGCAGSPADVTPSLDRADPPAGRCLRKPSS